MATPMNRSSLYVPGETIVGPGPNRARNSCGCPYGSFLAVCSRCTPLTGPREAATPMATSMGRSSLDGPTYHPDGVFEGVRLLGYSCIYLFAQWLRSIFPVGPGGVATPIATPVGRSSLDGPSAPPGKHFAGLLLRWLPLWTACRSMVPAKAYEQALVMILLLWLLT